VSLADGGDLPRSRSRIGYESQRVVGDFGKPLDVNSLKRNCVAIAAGLP
jgi:hypothetical protein